MKGIQYISTPRPPAQRGGGAAITVRQEKFTVSKLNIPIPKSVEVVWGLVKPKHISGPITKIIVCCFYSPPRSKKNRALIDHLTVTLSTLLTLHPNSGILISGDRNSIDIQTLCAIEPSLKELTRKPTRGHKCLDVILSNLGSYYEESSIIPPIFPDILGHGVQSDHKGVILIPRTNSA